MQRSFIKLYRDIQETPVFSNPELLKVYIYCLFKAAHKTQYIEMVTGRGKTTVTIQPGQLIWGRLSASNALNLSPSKCERHLKRLVKLGFFLRENKKHFSKITILLDAAQIIDNEGEIKNNEQAMNRQRTGNEQAMNTYKNDKKEKKEERESAPEKLEDQQQPANEYKGGGKIALPFKVKSLFIQAGGLAVEDDLKHFSKIAYSMRDIIQQAKPNGGRPSDKVIIEGVKAVFENMPDWVKEKGFFSPSGIARNFSSIINEIRQNKRQISQKEAEEVQSRPVFAKRQNLPPKNEK